MGKKVVSMVRGIRNNNPGNIRLSPGTTWEGQVPANEQTDSAYVQFIAPEFGIRAMARVLKSYAARGVVTLGDIVSTWAPPGENKTAEYIQAMTHYTGLPASARITVADYPSVIAGLIRHENGLQPYDSATLAKGISMA